MVGASFIVVGILFFFKMIVLPRGKESETLVSGIVQEGTIENVTCCKINRLAILFSRSCTFWSAWSLES